ncbi:MAG: sterol homeostasis protein [Pleopsidium flavum]|nr:MAG: sterol homeostasis protein [Pleopsidium flavum]
MPICIECRYPVHRLYDEYSKADDRSLGKGVRLTQCPRCKRFADKYVEHDFVVLFIDLVLIKPQPSIIRLGILLLLFDVYLTWARVEKASPPFLPISTTTIPSFTSTSPIFFFTTTLTSHPPPPPSTYTNPSTTTTATTTTTTTTITPGHPHPHPHPHLHLTTLPILLQYTIFLTLTTLSTLTHHLTLRLLAPFLLPSHPRAHAPNSLSTALLVSSCTKLFPILMVIWDYDVPAAARSVGWAVVVNNVEALSILLDCGYGTAGVLAGAGAGVGWAVKRVVLGAVGLEGEGGVVRDLVEVGEMVRGWAGRVGLG